MSGGHFKNRRKYFFLRKIHGGGRITLKKRCLLLLPQQAQVTFLENDTKITIHPYAKKFEILISLILIKCYDKNEDFN